MNEILKIPVLFVLFMGFQIWTLGQDSISNTQALKKADSLFYVHYEEAKRFRDSSSHQQAVAEIIAAEQVARQFNLPELIAKAKLFEGKIYANNTEEYSKAIQTFKSILDLSNQDLREKTIARTHSELGSVYQNIGDYPSAINAHLEALKLFEKLSSEYGQLRSLYELGRAYFQKGDYRGALSYFEASLKLVNKNWGNSRGDSTKLYQCYAGLGSTYERLKDLDQSLKYNLQSKEIAEALGKNDFLASAFQNLGTNYTHLGNFEASENALLRSLELFKQEDDNWGIIGTHLYLGKLYNKWDNPSESLKYLHAGLDLASQKEAKDRINEYLISLADTHKAMGDLEASERYLRSYIALKETVINESVIMEIKEAQWDYTLLKKQLQIELLEKEKAVSQMRTIIISTLLFFCLLGLLFFYWWNKRERETNLILEEKNKAIENANTELKTVNEELKQFTSVASHDLKEPLRTISTFTALIERHNSKQLDENTQGYLKFIKDASLRMQALLEDLLSYARIDRKQALNSKIKTCEVVKNALANLQHSILQTQTEVIVHYDALPKVKGQSTLLTQVFQNIISNAIKFQGDHKPVIEIDCKAKEKFFEFSIKDNGIGIPEDKREKIFEMFSRLHNRTAYEGTGIGLPTCKKIIEKHGGTIWVTANSPQGSIFNFTLPKKKSWRKTTEEKKTEKN